MRRRLSDPRLVVGLSLVGLVSAFWFAFGPVHQKAGKFTLQLTETSDVREVAIAPLTIARAEPDRLAVSIPCDEPGSEFASARDPDDFNIRSVGPEPSALIVPPFRDRVRMVVGGGRVQVELGSEPLLSASVNPAIPCVAQLVFGDGRWDLTVQDQLSSAVARGPGFSEAQFVGPAASSSVSSVVVETRELGTSPSGLQVVLFALAIGSVFLSMGAALSLVATRTDAGSIDRSWSLRSIVGSVAVVDVAVVVTLMAWLVFLPPQIDEGWTRAITGAYGTSGEFTPMYDGVAAAPLGYWLLWIQTMWFNLTGLPALMRILPLTIGVGIWAGLRSIGRSYDIPGSGGSLWLVAAVYVTGFGAFGMTLRPEPIVMALMTASVVIAVRFGRRPSSRLLAGWAVVGALAVSGNPSGVVVLAPLFISLPNIWRWVRLTRSNRISATVFGLSMASLTVLLSFLDSNVGVKMESLRTFRSDGRHGFGILDEHLRYGYLDASGPTMHRLAVVVMVVAVVTLLLRWHRRRGGSTFPAATLAVGLGLLAVTPSKWFWHFGGLVPIAALASAIEFRLVEGWRRIVILGGMAFALAWVWSGAVPWTYVDLRTQDWWVGATNLLPFDLANPVTWVALAGAVWGLTLLVKRRQPALVEWSPVEGVALLAAGLVIAVTFTTFVLDFARTDGWTYAKQSISDLTGSGDCGLGEVVRVPAPGSVDRATLASGSGVVWSPEWEPVSVVAANSSSDIMIAPELVQFFGCIALPPMDGGVVNPPDLMVLTPVVAWEGIFMSAALSDDFYRLPAPIPPYGDDGAVIIIVSHEYLTGSPARATHQFEIDFG